MVAKVLRGINEFRLIYSVKKHRHHRGWGEALEQASTTAREVDATTHKKELCEEMMLTRLL